MLELFAPRFAALSRVLSSTNVQRSSYGAPYVDAAARSSTAASMKVRKSQVPQSVEAL